MNAVLRAFEVLMATVGALAVYEILAIGYGLTHGGDMSHTITAFMTQSFLGTVIAVVLTLVFCIGLVVHFILERRQRTR